MILFILSESIINQKKGKLSTSHRYNLIPLLPSDPGGVLRELVVYDFPVTNIANKFSIFASPEKPT